MRGVGEHVPLTPYERAELGECRKSLAYFIENYVYIHTKDSGMQLFKLEPRQKKEVSRISFHDKVYGCQTAFHSWYRQAGYSSIIMAYVLWKMTFFPNTTALLPTARKWHDNIVNMDIFRDMYIWLPYWLKPVVTQWTKKRVSFENLSCIDMRPLNKSCDQSRGFAVNILVLDWFDGAPSTVARGIVQNLVKTMQETARGRIFVSGFGPGKTVAGQFWESSKKTKDGWFSTYSWEDNPKLGKEWADEKIRCLGEDGFRREYVR